jgi:hypothetical protein
VANPGFLQFNTAGIFTITMTTYNSLGLADPTPAVNTISVLKKSPIIPQKGWRLLYADSQELAGEPGGATNAFDGNPATIWHTAWSTSNPKPPHEIQIDLGQSYSIDGFRMLPRQDGGVNGRIGQYEFYVSNDGITWGLPIATGTFTNNATEKEVLFVASAGRYIRLKALTEVNGKPWTSVAEINVLGR